MRYLFLLLFLAGCGHTPTETIITVPVYVEVVCLESSPIESIKTFPVIFVQAVDTEGNQVLGLSGEMYSSLALNSAETLRYIKEQKITIGYYKTCIENHNSTQHEEGP